MRVLNEFKVSQSTKDIEIKQNIVQDLCAKIGYIKGYYPNKVDSSTNADILLKHFGYDTQIETVSMVEWNNESELHTMILETLPISRYFFGKKPPIVMWYVTKEDTVVYTLIPEYAQ